MKKKEREWRRKREKDRVWKKLKERKRKREKDRGRKKVRKKEKVKKVAIFPLFFDIFCPRICFNFAFYPKVSKEAKVTNDTVTVALIFSSLSMLLNSEKSSLFLLYLE
jgi:hypothetical protein